MKMRMNQQMRKLYDLLDKGQPVELPPEVENLALSGFIHEAGCVFLKGLHGEAVTSAEADPSSLVPPAFHDETGFECFVNHVHFPTMPPKEVLGAALAYVQTIESQWRLSGLLGELRFIVSVDDQECVVRFHRIRPNQNWIDDDLEDYKLEGVLVYDTTA